MTTHQLTASAFEKAEGIPPAAFSVCNAAQQLGISESHLWKLIRLNQIKAVKLLGRTVVPASEINRVLAVDPEPIAA